MSDNELPRIKYRTKSDRELLIDVASLSNVMAEKIEEYNKHLKDQNGSIRKLQMTQIKDRSDIDKLCEIVHNHIESHEEYIERKRSEQIEKNKARATLIAAIIAAISSIIIFILSLAMNVGG
jgi:ABC-type multidrug transport system fused ATPase/permease subunit